jgi:predicted membrane channel-forming protein YqfA (hemolysin III family)
MSARGFVILGWLVFVASAMAFTVSAWKAGDPWALAGALLFLIACLLFLWPLLRRLD